MKRPEFTEEQLDYLIYIIDEWYLAWKTRMTGEDGKHPRPAHRLGRAKEQLKEIIYTGKDYASGVTFIDFLEALIDAQENDDDAQTP
jgi:hypothetical protein